MNNQDNIDRHFREFDKFTSETVPHIIAQEAVEYFRESLIEKQWDGVGYTPYKNKESEPSAGSLMLRSNNLLNSIHPSEVSSEQVVISAGGPKVPYAKAHNEGFKYTGKRKVREYVNKNYFGKKKSQKIKAHERTVDYTLTQRKFMGKSPILNKRIFKKILKAHNNRK